ncbi:MAG: c-type cytochrome [Oligoflexia bacterium]|nr:c-type cytochrome [Oligoflexia bacterium]
METKIPKLEKKVITVAFVTSAVHLGLIAYAAVKLGITVPTCVTNVKPFTTGAFIDHGQKRYEVHVLAKMWGFEPSRIRVPRGSIVDFYLTSKDVNHGFNIDRTNVNLMAVPYVVNYAQARFETPGKYPVICHEYCGAGHQAMNAMVEVAEADQPAEAEGIEAAPSPSIEAAAQPPGQKIMQTKGCFACHSVNGSPGVGPTFKGVWGRKETLSDGTAITVDEPYVIESIRKPQAKVVKGFGPVMPTIPMTDQELKDIIEYMKTIK